MNKLYRLEFEAVPAIGVGSMFYTDDGPFFRPEEIPDEYWTKCQRDTDDPWQQYNQLRAWAESGEQLIRNVRLFEAASEIQWKPVPKDRKGDRQ